MALNATSLAADIKADILANVPSANDDNGAVTATANAIAESVVDHILANLEITVPSGEVIIAVSGGSGAPAVGTPNASPIDCGVA